ncbi:MAG: 30S ribosomal protein S9 [Candidatus Pacebacteria bacterium]|nr:30S ribosomal protein S9 [Candidatus Paceibacterota bacterium]
MLKKEEVKPEEKEEEKKAKNYYEGVGSRKTATARVRLYTKNKDILINGKDYKVYFPLKKWQATIEAPFEKMKCSGKFGLTAHVVGGGLSAQAEAVRLGISRALVAFNPDFKKRLRRAGYLTRDSRMVERKKYGLKKARRAPQWSKR